MEKVYCKELVKRFRDRLMERLKVLLSRAELYETKSCMYRVFEQLEEWGTGKRTCLPK